MANRDLDDWVRLDVNFFHNPKVRRAGGDGQLLWIAGLLWCARSNGPGGGRVRLGSDDDVDYERERFGHVGDSDALAIVAGDLNAVGTPIGFTPARSLDTACRLHECGLWTWTDGCYQIVDFDAYYSPPVPRRGVLAHIMGPARVHACSYCGRPASCWDHVLPRSRGGLDHEDNLVPSCASCNSAKGARTPEEWWATRASRPMPDAWPRAGLVVS